jgi:hypothetical protein
MEHAKLVEATVTQMHPMIIRFANLNIVKVIDKSLMQVVIVQNALTTLTQIRIIQLVLPMNAILTMTFF